MRIVADLHIHSPYARAVSKEMTLENLDKWAKIKGITVMGTGDFTHPAWIKALKEKLVPAEPGLYRLRQPTTNDQRQTTRFMLTVEISSIYSKNGKTRRIHNLIFSPSVETAEKINAQLGWQGNLKSDGRPILGLDSKELAKIVFNIDSKCVMVPAHAWTPWFSIFGSMSGFDSIEECFEEFAPQIFAIETGLSSDPAMNRRWSKLDHIALISNSDSHSLHRIGREANVFNAELSYDGIIEAIRSKDPEKFLFTIEFFPEEGRYHYDGHRLCKYSCNPFKTKDHKDICPVCGKKMTIGVLNRVQRLADRAEGGGPANAIPFKSFVPLDEIVGEALSRGVSSKKVKEEYMKLIKTFGSEFAVLVDASETSLRGEVMPEIAEGIIRVRNGKVAINPGYDGEYGKIKIFEGDELKEITKQTSLF